MPKIIEGRRYLHPSPGTTLVEARLAILSLPREVLIVADQSGRLLYAPLIGEGAEVSLEGFNSLIKNRTVSHNHPKGSILSPYDIESAIECDMLRLEAVAPGGTIFSVDRPKAGWPDVGDALRAYRNAGTRVLKKKGPRRSFRDDMFEQLNKAFGRTDVFGDRTIEIVRSRVD